MKALASLHISAGSPQHLLLVKVKCTGAYSYDIVLTIFGSVDGSSVEASVLVGPTEELPPLVPDANVRGADCSLTQYTGFVLTIVYLKLQFRQDQFKNSLPILPS